MAKLENCSTCGNATSENAKLCPSCGEPLAEGWATQKNKKGSAKDPKKSSGRAKFLAIVAGVFIAIFLNPSEEKKLEKLKAENPTQLQALTEQRKIANQEKIEDGVAATQMWGTADTVNRRTCPSTKCGVVGKLFFRESAKLLETKNGWGRITKYYDASCSGGRSQYVDSGHADCVASNGIKNGQFAEWVKLSFLSEKQPADPSSGAIGTAKLIAQSDDFRHYETEFVSAAEILMASKKCTAKDFINEGGWVASSNKGKGIYFTYCGGGSKRIYLDVSTGRTFE